MPTVKDLFENRNGRLLREICIMLDSGHWLPFTKYLHDKKYIAYPYYKELDKHRAGGQNPATEFLNELLKRDPDTLISKFKENATNLKRGDIKVLLDNEQPDCKLKEMSEETRIYLEILLDADILLEGDWKHFAAEYSFSYNEIELMDSRRSAPKSYSPTRILFKEIKQQKPDLDLHSIFSAALSVGRKDVCDEIEKTFGDMNGQPDNSEDKKVIDETAILEDTTKPGYKGKSIPHR